jgi:hypothetical protein
VGDSKRGAYSRAMRFITCLSGLALILSGTLAAAETAAPDLSRLTGDHRAMLECAAVFAVVASEQEASADQSLAYPPLAWRGKEYFVLSSTRVMDEAGLSREAVRDLLTADVAALQQQAQGSDPDAVIAAAMKPCLPRLDATVPPLEKPDLLQCSAILKVAYEDVHAREGLSRTAQDLATLASVLTAREKEALTAAGASPDAADRTIAEAHDKLLADAFDPKGAGAEKYDIAHCYELAKPDPKKHY